MKKVMSIQDKMLPIVSNTIFNFKSNDGSPTSQREAEDPLFNFTQVMLEYNYKYIQSKEYQ
jgi:hypothetical protein